MHQHHQQRLTALRTLAELAEHHQLPMPMSIHLSSYATGASYLGLRMDDDDRAGVTAWAAILGLPGQPDTLIPGPPEDFIRAWAEKGNHSSPNGWLDFTRVKVWAACTAATTVGSL